MAKAMNGKSNFSYQIRFTFEVVVQLFRCVYLFGFVQVLKDALTKLHAEGIEDPLYQPVHTYVLNPKVSNQ